MPLDIFTAAARGGLERVKELVEEDPEAATEPRWFDGTTPLFLALHHNQEATATFLLSLPSVSAPSHLNSTVHEPSGYSPLYHTVKQGEAHKDLVSLLLLQKGLWLDRGLPLTTRETPLMAAIHTGNTETALLLLQHAHTDTHTDADAPVGVSVNATELGALFTPLHVAAIMGDARVCVSLLEKHVNPFLVDREGKTAKEWALEKGHAACVHVIEEAEQALLRKAHEEKDACACVRVGDLALLRQIVSEAAQKEKGGGGGGKKGTAPAHQVDSHTGATLLHLAARLGQQQAPTYTHTQAKKGDGAGHGSGTVCVSLVRYLLNNVAGVKVNAKDCFGNVPLFYAVVGGSVEAVSQLLEHPQANPLIENEEGDTPWTLAQAAVRCRGGEGGTKEIMELVKEKVEEKEKQREEVEKQAARAAALRAQQEEEERRKREEAAAAGGVGGGGALSALTSTIQSLWRGGGGGGGGEEKSAAAPEEPSMPLSAGQRKKARKKKQRAQQQQHGEEDDSDEEEEGGGEGTQVHLDPEVVSVFWKDVNGNFVLTKDDEEEVDGGFLEKQHRMFFQQLYDNKKGKPLTETEKNLIVSSLKRRQVKDQLKEKLLEIQRLQQGVEEADQQALNKAKQQTLDISTKLRVLKASIDKLELHKKAYEMLVNTAKTEREKKKLKSAHKVDQKAVERDLKKKTDEKKELEAKQKKTNKEIKRLEESLRSDTFSTFDAPTRTRIQQAKALRRELYVRLLHYDREIIQTQRQWAQEAPELAEAYLRYLAEELPDNKALSQYLYTGGAAVASRQLWLLAPEYKRRELALMMQRHKDRVAAALQKHTNQRGGALGARRMLQGGLGLGGLREMGLGELELERLLEEEGAEAEAEAELKERGLPVAAMENFWEEVGELQKMRLENIVLGHETPLRRRIDTSTHMQREIQRMEEDPGIDLGEGGGGGGGGSGAGGPYRHRQQLRRVDGTGGTEGASGSLVLSALDRLGIGREGGEGRGSGGGMDMGIDSGLNLNMQEDELNARIREMRRGLKEKGVVGYGVRRRGRGEMEMDSDDGSESEWDEEEEEPEADPRWVAFASQNESFCNALSAYGLPFPIPVRVPPLAPSPYLGAEAGGMEGEGAESPSFHDARGSPPPVFVGTRGGSTLSQEGGKEEEEEEEEEDESERVRAFERESEERDRRGLAELMSGMQLGGEGGGGGRGRRQQEDYQQAMRDEEDKAAFYQAIERAAGMWNRLKRVEGKNEREALEAMREGGDGWTWPGGSAAPVPVMEEYQI